MKQRLCTTHSNNYDELEKVILNALKDVSLKYMDKKRIEEQVIKSADEKNNLSIKKDMDILENDIKQLNDNLDDIYIDKLNKVITEEQFERVKIKLENELNIKQKRYNELNNSLNHIMDKKAKNKVFDEYINTFLSMKEPSRELIIHLIDEIKIFEDKTINIKVTFNNNY